MKAAADEAEAGLPSAANTVPSPAAAQLTAQAANAVQPRLLQQRRSKRRSRHLNSSLALEPGLRNHWYPAHFSSVRFPPPARSATRTCDVSLQQQPEPNTSGTPSGPQVPEASDPSTSR